MHHFKSAALAFLILSFSSIQAFAKINVVATIKPVHSLVSSVMEGVGKPDLIIDGANSPHTFAMKPSQAAMIERAKLIFWIGEDLEAFMEKPLSTIGKGATSISLLEAKGVKILQFREGKDFDAHDHGDHDDHKEHGHKEHDDHKEHGHKDHGHDDHKKHEHKEHGHDDHKKHAHKEHGHDDHKKHAHKEHGHKEHDDHKKHGHEDHHDHGGDPHIWLDPANAKAMATAIAEALAKADPKNAATYKKNEKKLIAKLDALMKKTASDLKPVAGKQFIVFHDAYQYFEKRFGLKAAGSITVSPEILPGAERIRELKKKVKRLGATCVFAEPQFEPKIIKTVTEGTKAKSGVLDPLGADTPKGVNQYFQLIRNMASSFSTCLK